MNAPYMLVKTMKLVKTPTEVLPVTVLAVLEDRAAMKVCSVFSETYLVQ